MNNLFIKPQYLKMLTEIFDKYCPHAEIWAYGSRINGEAHEGSDLDLVIKTLNSQDIHPFELKEIISNSNIPFIIDLQEFDNLPASFQKEILKNYIVIYRK